MKSIELFGDGIGKVEYVQHMGDDRTIVNAARVSFGKEVETLNARDEKLIRYLINHRHTSTLEHNHITFRFTVPLFIRSQHHRHRTWSYNEISRRYTDVNLQFYQPHAFRTQHKSNRQASNTEELIDPTITPRFLDKYSCATQAVEQWHAQSLDLFDKLIEAGVCREQARGVLPQNLYTEYYGSCNANNLLKFLELRLHDGAQWEIQQVAKACGQIAAELWPVTMSAYQEVREVDFGLENV